MRTKFREKYYVYKLIVVSSFQLSFVHYPKIRQKEEKKIQESLTADSEVVQKRVMMQRLPELCRILKTYPFYQHSLVCIDLKIQVLILNVQAENLVTILHRLNFIHRW